MCFQHVYRASILSENMVYDLVRTLKIDQVELVKNAASALFQVLHFLLYCIFVSYHQFLFSFLHFILCRMCVCHMFNEVLTYLLTYVEVECFVAVGMNIFCQCHIL